jgi:hypothetical protein
VRKRTKLTVVEAKLDALQAVKRSVERKAEDPPGQTALPDLGTTPAMTH